MRATLNCTCLFLLLIIAVLPIYAQPAIAANDSDGALPNAPQPTEAVAATLTSLRQPVQQTSAVDRDRRPARRLAKVIDPDEQAGALRPRDKLELAFHEQIMPYAFATEILSAGWGQLLDTSPKYGTDKAAFGERLGAAAIRQSSQAVFADGVLPIVFRQDPRYYRKGSGGILRRVRYAAGRVFIGRTDTGSDMFNYSKIIGYAGSSALTTTYYPDVSAGWGTTAKGYGTSLATAMLGNQIREFGPDAIHLIFHRQRHDDANTGLTDAGIAGD